MADVSAPNKKDSSLDLLPGFRFHPTDEEIITHYLCNKVMDSRFTATAIGEVDLNKCEPWDLPSRAKMGEKEYYFFCQRDRKYPTGMRTNRATEAGYWKATGKDKEIFRGKGVLVGMKKTLVFYTGRAPKGEKTNWVMHEFRLEGKQVFINLPRSTKDEWVVSKVFHKNNNMDIKKISPMDGIMRMNSFELPDSPLLPPLMDTSFLASFDLKGNIPASSSPMPSFMMMEDLQAPYFPVPSTGFYPPQTPYFPLGPAGSSYLNQDTSGLAMRRHCKVEQFSGQSMLSPSQDTGVSTDRNTETGSGYSYVDDLDDPTSAEAVIDFDNMWKF